MRNLDNRIDELFNFSLHLIKENRFDQLDEMIKKRDAILLLLDEMEKVQIKRIKLQETNTRNSVLFFNTISESKNLLLHFVNVVKAYRDFVTATKQG
jgi:Na+/phosphate symporter